MFPLKSAQRMDEKRLAYAEIGAGVAYLVAFNTFLPAGALWYLGYILIVAVLCLPFVFTARAGNPDRNGDRPLAREPKLICGTVDAGKSTLDSARTFRCLS